ncbi:MAG TPA: TfoX/Sxy family protein [Herpetosiphonaceae bacterium]
MAVSDSYRDYIVELLEPLAAISTRRMFGGLGVYANGLFVALASDDVLYFKVDDGNRPDFEAAGMAPFRPFGEDRPMQYYEVPADVMEDQELLGEWLDKSIAAAENKPAPKKRRR